MKANRVQEFLLAMSTSGEMSPDEGYSQAEIRQIFQEKSPELVKKYKLTSEEIRSLETAIDRWSENNLGIRFGVDQLLTDPESTLLGDYDDEVGI